jgi:hypothetical protein
MSDPSISVEWHSSFSYDEGYYEPIDSDENSLNFIRPHDKQASNANQVLKNIRDLAGGDLFDVLSEDHGIEKTSVFILWATRLWRPSYRDSIFGGVVETSSIALIGTAIRGAKDEPGHEIELTAEGWTDMAFAARHLNPWGEIDKHRSTTKSWYEYCTGISEPELQHKTIGRVALAIIESDILADPQEIAFRGNLATIQTTR